MNLFRSYIDSKNFFEHVFLQKSRVLMLYLKYYEYFLNIILYENYTSASLRNDQWFIIK